jgi:hypothetical protein
MHDMVVAERRRIKGMTWTQERLEKSGSGGLQYRYRRYGLIDLLLSHAGRIISLVCGDLL